MFQPRKLSTKEVLELAAKELAYRINEYKEGTTDKGRICAYHASLLSSFKYSTSKGYDYSITRNDGKAIYHLTANIYIARINRSVGGDWLYIFEVLESGRINSDVLSYYQIDLKAVANDISKAEDLETVNKMFNLIYGGSGKPARIEEYQLTEINEDALYFGMRAQECV
jgi:hypothetical protein